MSKKRFKPIYIGLLSVVVGAFTSMLLAIPYVYHYTKIALTWMTTQLLYVYNGYTDTFHVFAPFMLGLTVFAAVFVAEVIRIHVLKANKRKRQVKKQTTKKGASA